MKNFHSHFNIISVLTFNLFLFINVDVFAADQLCDFRLATCPESFNGQTVYVPKKVIAFAPDFYVCKPSKVIENVGGKVKPPSIMFVIDNSNSMTGLGSEASDGEGVRFKVTKAIIDSIYKKSPTAEIGLIVFKATLLFDTKDNPNFTPLPDDYNYPSAIKTQAYLPLLNLSSTVVGGGNGFDLLKSLLETVEKDTIYMGTAVHYTTLKYEPQYASISGTNINTAFDAAKEAMKKAANAKENQFVIFLSDGEPYPMRQTNGAHGGKPPLEFSAGVNVPTTFTVYFNLAGSTANTVPASIATMTSNVQKNNYSITNPQSDAWAIQANYETLLGTLMDKAIIPIFSMIKQEPTILKLNGITYKDYREKDSTFYLPGGLQLKDSISNVKIEIKYSVLNDLSGAAYDSTVNIEFNVVRSDKMTQSNGILLNCRDTVLYQISVNATDPSAAEKDADPATIEFTRNNSNDDLAVYFTISGTATKKADYIAIADSAYFLPGQSKVSLEIKPITDINEEGDETVVVSLLASKNGRTIRYGIKQPDSAVVTIHDITKEDTVNVAVLINPFSPSALILDTIRSMYNHGMINSVLFQNLKVIAEKPEYKSGTFIMIQTSKQLKSLVSDNSVFGKAVIFDALGNKIKDLEVNDMDKDHGRYAAFWDGTNLKHRRVGNGVYLMQMNFTNTEGKTSKVNSKIGVKD